MNVLLSILVILSVKSFAGSGNDYLEYTPVGSVPQDERPIKFEDAKLSSKHIQISMNCSGTQVSPQGHILTAFHCIHNCLESRPVTITDKVIAYEVDEKKSLNKICEGYSSSLPGRQDYTWSGKFKVIAIGSNKFLSPKDASNLPYSDYALYSKLRQQGYTALGDYDDFAIIQKLGGADRTHLKLSCSGDDSMDEQLWSIAYPAYINKLSQSFYYEPTFTAGRVIEDPTLTAFKQDLQEGALTLEQISESFFHPPLAWSSLDSSGGASGSGVLNSKGEVVGLTILGYTDRSEGLYTFGNHGFIRISHIENALRGKVPEDLFNELFQCP